MNIASIKLILLAFLTVALLTGCQGYAKAGAERNTLPDGRSESRVYGEIGITWLVQSYANSMFNMNSTNNSQIDPATWELELDPSFGLSTSLQGN